MNIKELADRFECHTGRNSNDRSLISAHFDLIKIHPLVFLYVCIHSVVWCRFVLQSFVNATLELFNRLNSLPPPLLAQSTLDIYFPINHFLGMGKIERNGCSMWSHCYGFFLDTKKRCTFIRENKKKPSVLFDSLVLYLFSHLRSSSERPAGFSSLYSLYRFHSPLWGVHRSITS